MNDFFKHFGAHTKKTFYYTWMVLVKPVKAFTELKDDPYQVYYAMYITIVQILAFMAIMITTGLCTKVTLKFTPLLHFPSDYLYLFMGLIYPLISLSYLITYGSVQMGLMFNKLEVKFRNLFSLITYAITAVCWIDFILEGSPMIYYIIFYFGKHTKMTDTTFLILNIGYVIVFTWMSVVTAIATYILTDKKIKKAAAGVIGFVSMILFWGIMMLLVML